MSAITKPLVYTAAPSLKRDAEVVSIEEVEALSKLNNVIPLPKKDDYMIIFSMKGSGGGRPRTVEWVFELEAERDIVYTNLLTYGAQVIAHT